jgi:hypothetical protein
MFEAPVKPAGFIPARQAPDTTGSGRDHFFACEKAVAKKDELQEILDKCLTEREYVRIILNADQQKRLSKLKHHTAARTAYLHSVDPISLLLNGSGLAPQTGLKASTSC